VSNKKIKNPMSRKKKIKICLIFSLILLFVFSPFIFVEVVTESDGVWNPNPSYQRYRLSEYDSNRPFFQWWYFSLKDYQDNQTFAFTYSMTRPVQNLTYSGCYVLFAQISETSRFHIINNYSLTEFSNTDPNEADINIADSKFQISILTSDHYKMNGSSDNSNIWVREGISDDTSYSWDLDIWRIAGWYGQQDIEFLTKGFSLISWNTYAYDSEVNGTITVNSTTYVIDRNSRYRIYCDMNWGQNFPDAPTGEQPIDYPWGWYYTAIPNSTPTEDVAIIAGVGRSKSSAWFIGNMIAKFASIYIRGEKIGVREGKIWDATADNGFKIMSLSSDGKLLDFHVDRSNWITFTDIFGSAEIPLNQSVTIETQTMKIIMDYHSKAENYNRLIFPTDGYVFSDFEALGVNCTTTIYRKTYSQFDLFRLFPSFTLDEVLYDYNAGLEYGYRLDLFI
jgi:hypothetical protein